MAYRNKDVEGLAWLFGLLFVGIPALGLTGIGIGGYYLGAAIGLAGFAAFGAGGGIIFGGLVVLGLAALGVWGIVAGVMSLVEKNQQKKLQQEINNKPDLTVEGSTKSILQAAPPQKNPDAVPLLQNANVEAASAPEEKKPSFFSKIAGFFRSKKQNNVVPDMHLHHPESFDYPSNK